MEYVTMEKGMTGEENAIKCLLAAALNIVYETRYVEAGFVDEVTTRKVEHIQPNWIPLMGCRTEDCFSGNCGICISLKSP